MEISGLQQINCTSSESDNQVFSISGNVFELIDDSNYYGYYKDDGTIISYKSAKFFSKWERQGLFFLTYLTNIKYNCYHFARWKSQLIISLDNIIDFGSSSPVTISKTDEIETTQNISG